jgi:hypothetical protein
MKSSNFVAAAYLLHLLAPALFLLDVLTAGLHGQIALKPLSLQVVVPALWLLAGLGFFFLSRDREVFTRRVSSPLLGIYAVYLAFALGEVFLRTFGLTPPIPFMLMDRTRVVTRMDPAVYPGINGTKVFTVNALGLRGPLPPRPGSAYRIVTVGGSTTICANLDDSEEWPHLLMNYMNASRPALPVWVGNAGGAGLKTLNHIVLMQWLPGVIHVDMAIFLIGVNDLDATLAFQGGPTEAALEKQAGFEGALPPGAHWRSLYPRYRRLVLPALIHRAIQNLRQRIHPPVETPLIDLDRFRQRRAAAPVLPLPDLSTGLKEYRARIAVLANQCRDLQLRCLFLTQPAMWRSGLSPAEQRLLWLGYAGPFDHPAGFHSAADMGRAMDMYNQVLLDVCEQSGLECFDIASRIPKDTSAFFDDMHYNENGARLVARNLERYLASKPPFQAR